MLEMQTTFSRREKWSKEMEDIIIYLVLVYEKHVGIETRNVRSNV